MRRKNWAKIAVGFIVFTLVFVAFFGWGVHYLWNVLMPQLFGLPSINFWQALEMLTLSWLLFGGWRGVPRGGGWRGGHRGRWEALTPEERERLSRGRHWCGPREAAPAEGPQPPAP
jgi:hypothetical protein